MPWSSTGTHCFVAKRIGNSLNDPGQEGTVGVSQKLHKSRGALVKLLPRAIPEGWEVIEGGGEGLTAALGRDSLVLHNGEGMSAELNPTESKTYPDTITNVIVLNNTILHGLGTIQTADAILYIKVKRGPPANLERRPPLILAAKQIIRAGGINPLPVELTVDTPDGLDVMATATVGRNAIVEVSMSGGLVGDECSYTVYSASR